MDVSCQRLFTQLVSLQQLKTNLSLHRYQCLRCMRYDLCQHCFFYGLTNRGHRLDHPMREYCFRSSKRDATKAWIRLIINNIVYVGRRGSASHKNAKKRFLPHDPRLDNQPMTSSAAAAASASGTSEPAKRRFKVNGSVGKDNVDAMEDDDSSGFDSAVSSNQGCGAAQDAFPNESPAARAKPVFGANLNRNNPEAEFNAIMQHLEMNSAQMIDRLKMLEKLQQKPELADPSGITNISLNQPLRNCQSIQNQLDKLKELMESVFTLANEHRQPNAANTAGQADDRRNNQITKIRNSVVLEMNSFNEPTFMIESTPVVSGQNNNNNNNNNNKTGLKNKKMSRLAMDNNFSPIVFHIPRTPPPKPKFDSEPKVPPIVHDVSAAVDSMLVIDSGDDDVDSDTHKSFGDQVTLSNVSLADLTSLLAKTGFHGQTKLDLNVTEALSGYGFDHQGASRTGADMMDDLEGLLQKLEDVFQSFRDASLPKRSTFAFNNDAVIIGQIVSEIGDQLDAFAHHYRDSIAPAAN